ncbi:MAG TPA: hypothetical protein VFK78_09920 [Gemmatimonadales bacterium]|nr:hypothetical protein [Gemmatimonadales bacterium]
MIESRPITPTRLQPKGWARVGPSGAHTLRRGAWYPVVRVSSSNIVVLDVNRHNVPVDRRLLQIRYHPPERWTIVRCEPRELQRVGRIFPLTYGVCPTCRHRQGFEARVEELSCDRCHAVAKLAWDELS